MKIQVGSEYTDGFGQRHTIVGPVPNQPGVFFANTGLWFLEDGRLHFRVCDAICQYDLVDPVNSQEESRTLRTEPNG